MDYVILFLTIVTVAYGLVSDNWRQMALDELEIAMKIKQNNCIAKNIIIFIGDGMGPTTVTAGRIYRGQKNGNPGEETRLHYEKFTYTALSKTYGNDRQVSDSAQTATAILGGEKTNWKVIGLKDTVGISNCPSQKVPDVEVKSILKHAQTAGKSTGIVTTARITHATPAAAYAHTVDRDWESDAKMVGVEGGCQDIAYQLVNNNENIQVLLGGGRRNFIPYNETDPETNAIDKNQRLDGLNLTSIWEGKQQAKNRNYKYVWNKADFDNVNPDDTDYLLGLFNPSHMQYEVDRDTGPTGEPSLEEMTSKAIKILQKNSEGFFLLVEGARIDHAHHDSLAKRALEEVLTMEDAVVEADELTSDDDTLIIVTADHSHAFNLGGYNYRGTDILGSNDYIQASAVPVAYETHGGEDVAIYAKGPMAHLFHSVHEQHYIAYVMQYSACIGDYSDTRKAREELCSALSGSSKQTNIMGLLIFSFLILIMF